MKEVDVNIFSATEAGHRKAYIEFVSNLYSAKRVSAFELFFVKRPVFFLMIEENFFLYVLASFFRSITGKKTLGLLFRPKPAIESKSIKLRIKRVLLKVLKSQKNISTLTIIPFSIAPEFEEVADNWIYDFQLWDLERDSQSKIMFQPSDKLIAAITEKIGNRKVLVAIGSQNKGKGFETFANSWIGDDSIQNRFLFAYGGKVSSDLQALAANYTESNGIGFDRFISDEELHALYVMSDAVWCLYDPSYDQASGILGRAIQLGIPAIVRKDSLSHKLCQKEGAPFIAATEETISKQLIDASLLSKDPVLGNELTQRFRTQSLEVLGSAIGRGQSFK